MIPFFSMVEIGQWRPALWLWLWLLLFVIVLGGTSVENVADRSSRTWCCTRFESVKVCSFATVVSLLFVFAAIQWCLSRSQAHCIQSFIH